MVTEAAKRAHRQYYIDHPDANLLYQARIRAKRKGIPCTIERSDIVIPAVCPVFNQPFVFNQGKQQPFSPSIDRVDNTRGYEPDNILVVSYKANSLKKDATIDELKLLVAFYEQIT